VEEQDAEKCIMEIKLDYSKLSACRTYNSKEEKTVPGFKTAKDRLIFLLGDNASRGQKLKLYLVYHSENPCAKRNYAKLSFQFMNDQITRQITTALLLNIKCVFCFSLQPFLRHFSF
jgi:DDE superfamily endonuclease.